LKGVSVEVHRLPPATLALPFRRWHVVTFIRSDDVAVRRWRSSGSQQGRFVAGDAGIYPAGAGEVVTWPEGIEAVHVHLEPRSSGNVDLPYLFRLRDRALSALGDDLFAALRAPAAKRRTEAELVLKAVSQHLIRLYAFARQPDSSHAEGFDIEATLRFVADRMDGPLRVADIAFQAGLSRFRFTRAFHRVVGMPPREYVLRVRVERAKHLLSAGGQSLAGVAYSCGFADQSHLTRAFGAIVGTTPRRFRAAAEAL
jgi:AraC family transcriptional regulator